MRNIKLLIEYDGTSYCGWQRQENGRSIQGEIENVLLRVIQEQVHLIGAGRTDAGVHARGQTANFRSNTNLSVQEIQSALNALLPEDIIIKSAEEVPFDFHARYSAKKRLYSYLIALSPTAMMRNYSWFVKYQLDIDLMKRTTEMIIGERDFESFCRANSDVDHHVCTVYSANWEGDVIFLTFTICADRFLHGMVRTLVGTIVDVGRGYTTFEEFLNIFSKKDRTKAGISAPAKGLVLEEVIY